MDGMTFLKNLAKGVSLGGAYYFCGEDAYSLDKGIRAVVGLTNPDLRDMNVQYLKNPVPADVMNAAETLPFFDEKRVVIVLEFDADAANALKEYALKAPETTALVFVRDGKAPVGNPLYKALDKDGRAVSFDPLTTLQAEAFLQKRSRENGIPLERDAGRLLVQYLGTDLGALENTLLQLGAYVGFGSCVTRRAVETCVKPSSEYKVFAIMDKLWAGNKREGIAELAGLVNDPSESAMGLATLFERNLRVVVNAKQLLLGGKTEAQIVSLLGVAPFIAKKAVRNAKRRSLERLTCAMEQFATIEWRQKQGEAKAEEALVLACAENF
jgi:DNA polymerase-3 subunit delta